MIDRKQIVHRDYDGKECVHFEIFLEDDELHSNVRMTFDMVTAKDAHTIIWDVIVIPDISGELYVDRFSLLLPSKTLPLEKIAALAVYKFKSQVETYAQNLMNISFMLGDAIEGM